MRYCFNCDWELDKYKPGWWTTYCKECINQVVPLDPEVKDLLVGLSLSEAVMRIARHLERNFEFSIVVRYLLQANFFQTPRQAAASLGPTFYRLTKAKKLSRVGHGKYRLRYKA